MFLRVLFITATRRDWRNTTNETKDNVENIPYYSKNTIQSRLIFRPRLFLYNYSFAAAAMFILPCCSETRPGKAAATTTFFSSSLAKRGAEEEACSGDWVRVVRPTVTPATKHKHRMSDALFGINAEFFHGPIDYAHPKLADVCVEELGCAVIRWPGGTGANGYNIFDEKLDEAYDGYLSVWIGMVRDGTGDQFKWEDTCEDQGGYENWLPNQPNNAGGNQDCVGHIYEAGAKPPLWKRTR